MICYEEALDKARKMKGFFDSCTETEHAWLFHSEGDSDPLGSDACIVLKQTGECLDREGYRWHEASRNDWVLSSWRG